LIGKNIEIEFEYAAKNAYQQKKKKQIQNNKYGVEKM